MPKPTHTRAPKRKISRIIRHLDVTGASGDLNLRAAGDPVTLIRTIIDGVFYTITEGASALALYMEIWRKSNIAGAALPTQQLQGDVTYADDDDLLWSHFGLTVRETTSDRHVTPYYRDIKGMRLIAKNEDLIIRMTDGLARFAGTITQFFKET